MKPKSTQPHFPIVSVVLSVVTALTSIWVAFSIHGNPVATVSSADLLNHGAIDGETLRLLEIWRLMSAQFVHSKFGHMLFNVILVAILGSRIERLVGGFRFAVIWVFSGVLGTFASVLFLPQYVSSGASQALMGIAGASAVMIVRHNGFSRWYRGTLAFALIFQFGLDLFVAHYPKPGHVVGLLTGIMISSLIFRKQDARELVNP